MATTHLDRATVTPNLRVEGVRGEAQDQQSIQLSTILAGIWGRRRMIFTGTIAGLVLSGTYGIFHAKRYTASTLLMPPDSQSLTTTSTLAALNGTVLPGGLGGSGGLLNARTPGETVIGILGSRTIQDQLIDRFHLQDVYGASHKTDARKRLDKLSEIAEDKKSGLVHISVTDTNPERARDIANGYVAELNRVLADLNSSTAHRERIFLEERVTSLRTEIDQMANELSKFSSRTGTLNPTAQGQALVESVARSQLERGSAEAELSSLRAQYSDENVRVKAAQARVAALSTQLSKSGAAPNSPQGGGAGLPTLRELPLVAVTYTNLSQQLLAQQAVYALLTRQYEVARVEEAKQIPSVKLLDAAVVPDKPAGLNGALRTLLGTFAFAALSTALAIVHTYWQLLPETAFLKTAFASLQRES